MKKMYKFSQTIRDKIQLVAAGLEEYKFNLKHKVGDTVEFKYQKEKILVREVGTIRDIRPKKDNILIYVPKYKVEILLKISAITLI